MSLNALVRTMVEQSLQAANFFVAPSFQWRLEVLPHQTIRWEIFQGQLLGPSKTRREQTFTSWRVWIEPLDRATKLEGTVPSPWLAVHWSESDATLYVVRYLLVNGWEAVESSPGVIVSRPARQWLPELMSSIRVSNVAVPASGPAESSSMSGEAVRSALDAALRLVSTGVSRLPIVSVESPHPFFSLGISCAGLQGGGRAGFPSGVIHDPWQLWEREVAAAAKVGASIRPWVLEFLLRALSSDQIGRLAGELTTRLANPTEAIPTLLKSIFQQMSLTPYTDFVDKLLALGTELSATNRLGLEPLVDLFTHMLLHLVRHLQAYDLHRFHSYGANYPDALFLDRVLRQLLVWIDNCPELFSGTATCYRLRRRAMRMGWLLRDHYEGLLVPDHPTSQGENLRVLPGVATLPEDQILDRETRTRTLFPDRQTSDLFQGRSREVLEHSLRDLEIEREQLELGTATFLDRPVGIFKAPGEVDRTPLIAAIAFSPTLSGRHWDRMERAGFGDVLSTILRAPLDSLGIAARDYPLPIRPGVVSWGDALTAADDFRWLWTPLGSRRRLQQLLPGISEREAASGLFLRTVGEGAARRGEPFLTLFDARWHPQRPWKI